MTDSPPEVMRTPRSIDIELTAQCNLRCTYCYFFDSPAVNYRNLPTEAWLQFFEECGRVGVMNLTLAGGEPFMRKDLRVLLDGIVRNHMRFSLLSNGGLIDDEIAQSPGASVSVSLDGADGATHEWVCRVPGSFEGALAGLWRDAAVLRELRAGMPHRLRGVCADCIMRAQCFGTCVAQSYFRTQSLWSPFWFCEQAAATGQFPPSRMALTAGSAK